jgi:hypothetical protein
VALFAHGLLAAQIRSYLQELGRGDVDAICGLFTPDAQIFTPFLGWAPPVPFLAKVKAASGETARTSRWLVAGWHLHMPGVGRHRRNERFE